MQRRRFIQGTLSSLALGNAFSLADALAAEFPANAGFFLFDSRFARARQIALDANPLAHPVAVRGDVTAFWTEHLSGRIGDGPLSIEGITTESVAFCLEVLARDRATTDIDIRRVDRDLHRWTLHTFEKPTRSLEA